MAYVFDNPYDYEDHYSEKTIDLGSHILIHTKSRTRHILSLRPRRRRAGAIALVIERDFETAMRRIFGEYKTIEELEGLAEDEINELIAWATLQN